MTYHHVWLTKCNGDNCDNGHVEANTPVDPDGWVTDGTQHMCPDCVARQQAAEPEAEAEPDA